jgi:CBS domain-containing protein
MFYVTPPQLEEINKRVEKGETPRATVREFLYWFGAHRRGFNVVQFIRQTLRELNLETVPDFEGRFFDGPIIFRRSQMSSLKSPDSAIENGGTLPPDEKVDGDEPAATVAYIPADPAHRISRLKAANTPPTYVAPSDPIEKAITLMLINDFSQLPVMTSDREAKGIITWKSIGSRLAIVETCETVKQCMETHHELLKESSIFDAITIIERHDCVLVRDREAGNKIIGLVTAADISNQFKQLAEPFLLLGDIENHLRTLIGQCFSKETLQSAKNPSDSTREIQEVADLTFGEYVRILETPANWDLLQLNLDRSMLVKQIEEVRKIRNDVMHFDPDGIEEESLSLLRSCAKLLEQVTKLKSEKV